MTMTTATATTVRVKNGLFGTIDLHVDDTGGAGRPVVLIHGWPLSADSWSENIDAIALAGFRVIAYDRRGFGRSEKPAKGYDYDHLADDLAGLLEALDLRDVTLVGFSMGGGEIARYIARHGEERIHSVVFASAVTPYLLHSPANPDGPLTTEAAEQMAAAYQRDRDAFFEAFTTDFFSANGTLLVLEAQRRDAVRMAKESDEHAAAACMQAFAASDFRDDLQRITVPTLVIHGDADATVPFAGSGLRTHQTVAGSELHIVPDGPHGINVSHADEFDQVLVHFLQR